MQQSLQGCEVSSGSGNQEGFLEDKAFELLFEEWEDTDYVDMEVRSRGESIPTESGEVQPGLESSQCPVCLEHWNMPLEV